MNSKLRRKIKELMATIRNETPLLRLIENEAKHLDNTFLQSLGTTIKIKAFGQVLKDREKTTNAKDGRKILSVMKQFEGKLKDHMDHFQTMSTHLKTLVDMRHQQNKDSLTMRDKCDPKIPFHNQRHVSNEEYAQVMQKDFTKTRKEVNDEVVQIDNDKEVEQDGGEHINEAQRFGAHKGELRQVV